MSTGTIYSPLELLHELIGYCYKSYKLKFSLDVFAESPLLIRFDNVCQVLCIKYPKIELFDK